MSESVPKLVRSWRVGARTATLTVLQGGPDGERSAVIEWQPDLPSKLIGAELNEYRSGRDAAFQALGLNVLILEVRK